MFVVTFVDLLVTVLTIAIFARIILSWLPIGGTNHPIVALVYQITEPVLAPLRRIVPRMGMFDFTPMVAIIFLGLIRWAIAQIL